MYKNLFEKLRNVNEFDYEALYIEVHKIEPDDYRSLRELLLGADCPPDTIKRQVMQAEQDGLYIEEREGKVAELHNLPGRIEIPMMTYDAATAEVQSEKIEARFDPNDKTETLYISDEWI